MQEILGYWLLTGSRFRRSDRMTGPISRPRVSLGRFFRIEDRYR